MPKRNNFIYVALAMMMLFLSSSAMAQTATMDALEDMDRHWGQLIREQDPVKQKV